MSERAPMDRIEVVLMMHAIAPQMGWRPVHTESSDSQIVIVLRADGDPAGIEATMIPSRNAKGLPV